MASIGSGSLIVEKFFHESSVATEILAYRNKSMPNCLPDASHSERNLNRYALGQIAFLVKGVGARCLIFTKCMQLFVVESPVGKQMKKYKNV